MAWVVKPSGNMQIEKRDEPYLNDKLKAHANEELAQRYPTKQAMTLPLLHEIQHTYNWIPFQAIEEIGEFLELSAAEVWDTATFYEEFFLQPKGKYLIQICQSISCELCGQVPLQEMIEDHLGLVEGETSDDDKFTFYTVECLGSCDTAPVALINGHRYEKIQWEDFKALLDGLPEDPKEFDKQHGAAH